MNTAIEYTNLTHFQILALDLLIAIAYKSDIKEILYKIVLVDKEVEKYGYGSEVDVSFEKLGILFSLGPKGYVLEITDNKNLAKMVEIEDFDNQIPKILQELSNDFEDIFQSR